MNADERRSGMTELLRATQVVLWTFATFAVGALVVGGCAALLNSGAPGRGTRIETGGSQDNALVRADTRVSANAEVEVSPEISAAVDAAVASFRASIEADIRASLEAEITGIRGDVAVLQGDVSVMRDVSVGGGGDSVTAWLLVGIVGAALLYPLVIRPSRRFVERCAKPAPEGASGLLTRPTKSGDAQVRFTRAHAGGMRGATTFTVWAKAQTSVKRKKRGPSKTARKRMRRWEREKARRRAEKAST